MRLVKALDRHRRVTAAPYQNTEARTSVGLTVEECKAASWAVAPDGRYYRGAAAVNAALAVTLGTRLPLLVYDLPGVTRLQNRLYGFVAANRRRLPLPKDEPYCKQRPDLCR